MNYCSTFAASNNNKDVRKDDEQCIAYYSRGGPSIVKSYKDIS